MMTQPPQKRQKTQENFNLDELCDRYIPDLDLMKKWMDQSSGRKGIPSLVFLSVLSWAHSVNNTWHLPCIVKTIITPIQLHTYLRMAIPHKQPLHIVNSHINIKIKLECFMESQYTWSVELDGVSKHKKLKKLTWIVKQSVPKNCIFINDMMCTFHPPKMVDEIRYLTENSPFGLCNFGKCPSMLHDSDRTTLTHSLFWKNPHMWSSPNPRDLSVYDNNDDRPPITCQPLLNFIWERRYTWESYRNISSILHRVKKTYKYVYNKNRPFENYKNALMWLIKYQHIQLIPFGKKNKSKCYIEYLGYEHKNIIGHRLSEKVFQKIIKRFVRRNY